MTIRKQYRLADSTVVEPLVHKWHAWSQVLSPLTAGFHLLNYQCNTMKSYVDDPESHARACSDPALKGSPFINTPVDRAEEIRRLLDDTIAKLGKNMELAAAVVAYYNKLVDEAKGQSIEPFYESLPRELQGYVEMVYDYYNRPTLRILEGMLYESPYYDESLQSLRLFRLEGDASRDFFMSTPRLHNEGEINWTTPFAADRVDSLFRLEREFRPAGYIKDLLGLESVNETTFEKLFTQNAIAPKAELDRSLLRLRYYGHATVLMEWNGVAILTDPCISALPHGGGIERHSYHDLPDHIDFALVTHNHHDHLVFETLLRLRNRIGCLVVPKTNGLLYGDTSLRLMAKKLGIRNCLEFDPLDSVDFPGGEIIGVPFLGEHSDIAHSKISYVVRAGNERILFAADSACLDEGIYRNLRRIIGPIQTVFLGMECVGAPLTWHCGSLLPKLPDYHHDQSRRSHGCDAAGGLRLLEILEAKRFYNYAMGLEPWMEFLLGLGLTEASTQIQQSNQLLRKARGRGLLAAERLFAKRDIYLPSESTPGRTHELLTGNGVGECPGDQPERREPALWFLMASDPDPLFSIVSALAQVRGKLNLDALDCALRTTVSSDQVFASSSRERNGTSTRNGEPPRYMRLKVIDLTGLGSEEIADAVCASWLGEQGRPQDSKARPLPSACLISLSAENHYLVVTSHRLACDSWAPGRLLKAAAEIYANLVTDGAACRPDLPSPYRTAGGGAFDSEERRGAPLIFSSPGDEKYCVDPVRISGPLLESAMRLTADTECDLWLILLAVFQVMIQAIELGEEVDVRAIVEPANGQPPGYSTSVLRLVTDVSGSLSFTRLAERLREVVKRATETQKAIDEAAVAQLRREFGFDGEATLRPVFLIKRKFQAELRLPNSEWSFLDVLPARTASGLMLCLYQDAAGISGVLRHDANLLKSGTGADLCNQYEAILREVALNPGKPFFDLCSMRKAPDGGAALEGVDLNIQFDFFS